VTFAQKTTEEESTDSSEEETDVAEIQVTSPDDAYTAGNIGVYGDAQSLVLHTTRPARQTMLVSHTASLISSQGDLFSISYFLAAAGSSGLQGVVGDRFRNSSGLGDTIQGLTRLEGDRLAMS